jgi:hypothetical protein
LECKIYNRYTIKIYINRTKETLLQAKGNCSDRVHSDQMVIRTVRRKGWTSREAAEGAQTKLTQGGHQAQVHSDETVLVMARQEAGSCERQRKRSKED